MKFISPLWFDSKHFPRLVFVVCPLKFFPCQNYARSIIDNSLEFHFPVMMFLIPAENVCFRNLPAVFSISMSNGVVTGQCSLDKLVSAQAKLIWRQSDILVHLQRSLGGNDYLKTNNFDENSLLCKVLQMKFKTRSNR